MKLSVIVPVYGVEKYIARCVRSVLSQSYEDIEVIFVDDATPDQSVAILQQTASEFPQKKWRIVHHASNKGLAAARRTGIEVATGEYIMHVDSDDYLEHDALEKLAGIIQQTDADVVVMDFFFEWDCKRKVYSDVFSSDSHEYCRLLISGANMPNAWRHVIRRSLYHQTGIYPTEGLNFGEDYLVLPRICWFANRIAKIQQPLYHYRQTNASAMTRNVSETGIIQLTQVMHLLTAFYADKPECRQALRAGQWLKKTDTFMRAPRQYYPLVNRMPAALPAEKSTMNQPQRIAALFIAHQCWNTLWIFSMAWRGTLELIQILKGRRKSC